MLIPYSRFREVQEKKGLIENLERKLFQEIFAKSDGLRAAIRHKLVKERGNDPASLEEIEDTLRRLGFDDDDPAV